MAFLLTRLAPDILNLKTLHDEYAEYDDEYDAEFDDDDGEYAEYDGDDDDMD